MKEHINLINVIILVIFALIVQKIILTINVFIVQMDICFHMHIQEIVIN